MRKISKGSRSLAMLLALVMILSCVPLGALAAVGDLADVATGLDGDIDTGDTISLPIKILDYENDGMLFEYAEAYADAEDKEVGASKEASDFGASWSADFASQTELSSITTSMYGDFWTNTTKTLNTSNSYASFLRATWAKNSAQAPHTVYGRTGVIMPNDLGGLAMDSIRYLVLVYRSNVTSGKIGFFVERENADRNNTNNRVGDLTFTSEGTTNWTYAVYDLKQGNLKNTWTSYGGANAIWTTLPMDASGEYIDIAHVALFADKDQAAAFGEYALTDGSDRGDNRGFGLLRSSRNQAGGNNYAGIIDETDTVEQLNTYGYTNVGAGNGDYSYDSSSSSYTYVGAGNGSYVQKTVDFSSLTTLGYTLLGTFGYRGIANVGLLESSLSEEGYPVYKQEVVTYVANLLKHSLEIPERTDGWKNYRYVKGTASSVYGGVDLPTALRNRIKGNMGSYAAAAGKDLVGTWSEVSGNIASYYDAAYFLLNSIFVPGSYNVQQDDYDYLVLSSGTDSVYKDKVYIFDGGFSTSTDPNTAKMAINYDTTNNTIQNTSAAGKSHFYYETNSTTTLNPFLPITDRNTTAGMTVSPYYQDDGVINAVKEQTNKDTLYQRNFNFAMISEGEFVYHADDDLFFDFEGDDDVYLFINNELVMDIGSAHSIDTVSIKLNDYVNAAKAGTLGSDLRNSRLALEEGNTYSFKFYYMERHSYGSNIRIETNIHVTDPSMQTAKTAWQEGLQLDFGSVIDKDKVVEYGFAITNNGEENLYNLTFTDNDIGVLLNPTDGLKVTGSRVSDVNGGTLEASDLTAVITHPKYDDIHVTFADNNALKAFLKDLTASGTEAGGGLYIGATVQIRGIGYELSEAQVKAGVFDNTVLTTSTNKTQSKTLQGQAIMRVFIPADPMYYEWQGHDLVISKTKLITDILAAASQSSNTLNGKVPNLTTSNVNKIQLVTKSGTAISSPYVTIDGSNNLTVNYPTVGSKVFYVKVTYNSSKNNVIVPVLVNVTSVQDSVYVLDYGLNVNLTESGELIKNDVLTVPGRETKNSIIAVGTNGAYANNEITFTYNADGILETDLYQFTLAGQTLSYLPKDFMEALTTVQVAMNVYEEGTTPSNIAGTLNINKEVEMYKYVHVLPANVVYYEDCFPAITYETTNIIESVTPSKSQSNNQDENYGHDDTYESESGDNSAGTVTTITFNAYTTAASFQFKGTGFELIARTNAEDSANLVVEVKDKNGVTVKMIPVITEFDNGNDGGTEVIYQVPVIRVDGLDPAQAPFTVKISGMPAYTFDASGNVTGTTDTNLYVDGLRIFKPMTDEETEGYYGETEQGAQFIELRDEIVEGSMAVVQYTEEEGTRTFAGTYTWTEDLNGIDGNTVDSVDDYLLKGPNNEVYMYSEELTSIVFYVKETGDGAHNLQVAVRGIDDGLFFSGVEGVVGAIVEYGVHNNGAYAWQNLISETDTEAMITSSTEQYYTVDLSKCYYDATKGYQVVLQVREGMASFTSIKLVGLELTELNGESTDLRFVNGTLFEYDETATGTQSRWVEADPALYVNFVAVGDQMRSTLLSTDEEFINAVPEETPENNDQPGKGGSGTPKPGQGGGQLPGIKVEEGTENDYVTPGFKAGEELVVDGSSAASRNNLIKDFVSFLMGFWAN